MVSKNPVALALSIIMNLNGALVVSSITIGGIFVPMGGYEPALSYSNFIKINYLIIPLSIILTWLAHKHNKALASIISGNNAEENNQINMGLFGARMLARIRDKQAIYGNAWEAGSARYLMHMLDKELKNLQEALRIENYKAAEDGVVATGTILYFMFRRFPEIAKNTPKDQPEIKEN